MSDYIGSHIELPHGCIEAVALRSLAVMMERLEKFHEDRGGNELDRPCLRSLSLVSGSLLARICSGGRMYKMTLRGKAWTFV